MKQTPCEYIVRHGLPVLRKEIVKSMINDFDFSQKEAAKKIGVTSAAASQYLSGKRAKIDITDEGIRKEINRSAERIVQQGDGTIISETCRFCKIFSSKKLFPFTCDSCKDER